MLLLLAAEISRELIAECADRPAANVEDPARQIVEAIAAQYDEVASLKVMVRVNLFGRGQRHAR